MSPSISRRWHGVAAGALALAAAIHLWEWFAADRMPPGDFPGYVAQVQYVRDALLHYGRVPLWCVECYGGTTNFTGHLKEYAAFPLAVWVGPLLATKLLFAVLKTLSALGLYLVVVRLFGAPLAGLVAGYAYGFGAIANHQSEHLDVAVAAALVPPILLASVELLRGGRVGGALALGVLVAAQLVNHWVHAAPVPVLLLLLIAFRPWRELGDSNPWRDRRLAARWARLGALALGVFLLFSGSHLALIASDARNHRLSPPEALALERTVYIERSPFLFLNRENALGAWLARHQPPGLEDPDLDLAVSDAGGRYLGGVALATCLFGWLAVRRDQRLSRWARFACLMLLFQYWLALGPRTLLWEVGGSLHWPPDAQRQVRAGLLLASALCLILAGAVVLVQRRGAAGVSGARTGPFLAAALILFFPTASLWNLLLRVLPVLELQRSPGHYFDTAPFWFYLLLAISLVALRRRLSRPRVAAVVWAGIALAVVVDFWPSRRSFSAGLPMEALRLEAELVQALEGDGGTLRLVPTPAYSPLASWVAAQAPTGHAWGWLRWQSGRHWAEFLQAAAWRTEASAEPGGTARLAPDAVLLAIGRIRYFLLEAGSGPRILPPPWRLLRSGARFSVWEQPAVAPMASAYGAYAKPGVTYRREGPERIALEVESGAGPAMVFVSEGYHPWWRATVDGEPAPVLRAQTAFMAVPVGPGRHAVELHLQSPLLVAAAGRISAAAWIALALAVPVAAVARWRRAR